MSRRTFQQTVATILTLGILAAVLTFIGTSGPIRLPTTASAPKPAPAPAPQESTCHPDELWFNVHYHPLTDTIEQTVCVCLHGRKECAPYIEPKGM